MNVTVRGQTQHHRTVTFDRVRNAVLLIEQRLLPHEFKIVTAKNYRETARAITDMIVRGAGAIGATAACGLAPRVWGATSIRSNGPWRSIIPKTTSISASFCQPKIW